MKLFKRRSKSWRFTCPRRLDGLFWTAAADVTDEDYWCKPFGDIPYLTCSYCGSISPDEFMDACRSGASLGPTDKSYKVYVNDHLKFYFQHLWPEQRKEFVELVNNRTMTFDYPGYFYVLPFFARAVEAS